jgi:uncharacterized protein YuzE
LLDYVEQAMRIKYFENTETTVVELSTNPPVETRELNENLYIDLDDQGLVVSITIEHADRFADIQELLYQSIPARLPMVK